MHFQVRMVAQQRLDSFPRVGMEQGVAGWLAHVIQACMPALASSGLALEICSRARTGEL